MMKILSQLKEYWYVIVIAIVLLVIYFKKKKNQPINKDVEATAVLATKGIKDLAAQQSYKAISAQVANKLGTAYGWYNPLSWSESDEEVYELLKGISLNEFAIVKTLYFQSYAKGRDLSTDLANLLDKKYYSLLKVK